MCVCAAFRGYFQLKASNALKPKILRSQLIKGCHGHITISHGAFNRKKRGLFSSFNWLQSFLPNSLLGMFFRSFNSCHKHRQKNPIFKLLRIYITDMIMVIMSIMSMVNVFVPIGAAASLLSCLRCSFKMSTSTWFWAQYSTCCCMQ